MTYQTISLQSSPDGFACVVFNRPELAYKKLLGGGAEMEFGAALQKERERSVWHNSVLQAADVRQRIDQLKARKK